MKISWLGPIFQKSGYGRAFTDYCAALHQVGADLTIIPQLDVDTEEVETNRLHLLPNVGQFVSCQTFCIMTLPQFAHEYVADVPKGVKKVCFTTWETDKMPGDSATNLSENFDLVVVPSKYNANMFMNNGVPERKLAVVPYPFDTAWWYDPPIWEKPLLPYTFYNISVWSERKNQEGLVKAYLSAFGTGDRVKLVLVTPNIERAEVELKHILHKSGLTEYPPIELRSWQTREQIRDLHRQAHCYVTLARGEGWGLGAFEAGAMGNTVIFTDHGGLVDACKHARNKCRIPYSLTPVYTDDTEFGFTAKHNWAEPDLSTCITRMKSILYNKMNLMQFSADQEIYRQRYSYATIGKQLMELLH